MDSLKKIIRMISKVTVFYLVLLSFSSQAYAGEKTIYNYDSNGRLLSASLSNGVLVQYIYDNNGNLVKVVKINTNDIAAKGGINSITRFNGKITVTGWALDISGVTSLKLYINDVYYGEANYGLLREDIYQQYPEYNNRNSGFNFEIDYKKFEKVNVKVVQQGSRGNVIEYSKSLDIKIPEPPTTTLPDPPPM